MDAIRRILTDFEDAFPDPMPEEAAPEPAPEPAPASALSAGEEPAGKVEELTLTPVAVVDTKVASAKFTTVPNVERLSAVARVIESGMKTSQSAAQEGQSAARAPTAQAPAAKTRQGWKMPAFSWPSVSLPKLSLPLFTRPKVDAATVEAPTVEAPTVETPKAGTPTVEAPPRDTTPMEPQAVSPVKPRAKFKMPRVVLPTLPRVALPSMPRVALPKLGGVTLPRLSLPRLSLPKRSASHIDAPVLPTQVSGGTAKQANKMPQLREATQRTAPKLSREGLLSLRYHVTPLRVALAALAMAVLIWPAMMIFVLVLAVFLVSLPFLILGAEGVWDKVARVVSWYCARNPARKDAVYDGLDGLALRWDAILDRLPEDWVDGFYMPDFANLEELQHHHEKVVSDRLSRMQNQA